MEARAQKHVISPIEVMFAYLLGNWNHRYAVQLNRPCKTLHVTRGNVVIAADETRDGRIRTTIREGEQQFVRIGGPGDSARVIEAVLYPEELI